MKKLVMSALMLGGLSQAAGCIFVTSDDTTSDTAAIDVGWSLADGGCELAGTATINAQLVGDSTPYRDIYDCVDGSGITQDLPLGTYDVWVDLTDDSDFLVAQSESVQIVLDQAGDFPTADFAINMTNGYFDVGWTFAGGTASCADYVGEDGVSVLSTEVGNASNAFDDVFDCEENDGVTQAGVTAVIPVGVYTLSVAIIDGTGAALGSAPATQAEIDYGNEFEVVDVVISP